MTPLTTKADGHRNSATSTLWAMTASAALALPPFQKERGRLSSHSLWINCIKLSRIQLTGFSVSTPLGTLLPPKTGGIVKYKFKVAQGE